MPPPCRREAQVSFASKKFTKSMFLTYFYHLEQTNFKAPFDRELSTKLTEGVPHFHKLTYPNFPYKSQFVDVVNLMILNFVFCLYDEFCQVGLEFCIKCRDIFINGGVI